MYNMAVQVFAGRLRDAVHSCMSDQCKTLSTQGLVMLIRHARMICYSGPCPSTNLAKPCNTMVIWQDGSSIGCIGCTLLIVWSSCNTLFSVNNLKRDSSAQTPLISKFSCISMSDAAGCATVGCNACFIRISSVILVFTLCNTKYGHYHNTSVCWTDALQTQKDSLIYRQKYLRTVPKGIKISSGIPQTLLETSICAKVFNLGPCPHSGLCQSKDTVF